MADEDLTLDGKPLQSLRVADLKAALEQRNLPKSGQKNTLIKRLKGALMLENLQKSSSSHSGLQPNSKIGEEMCQNSFIKQYLAKQQELLCQRLEREAQQEEAEESFGLAEEDEEHSEDNDSTSYISDKDSLDASGAKLPRASFLQGHKEPMAPSPPRAVASLSVRVLGQPDRQGLPPAVPRAHEKEGTAPCEPGSAHPVHHLSRSARASAGSHAQEDSDEGDDGDDESDDDEDWGPSPGGSRRGSRAPPPLQTPPNAPAATSRSKRKLQPPQHIPPPQVHHTPMQLRHPTPPPSPPPNLFALPDTPKQSPPDNLQAEEPDAAQEQRASMQRQDSSSSSGSSSPEPPAKRRPGPLSLLVHKMETEKAFSAAEATSASSVPQEAPHSTAGPSSESVDTQKQQQQEEEEEEKLLMQEKQRQQEKKRLEEEEEKERKKLEEEKERKRVEEERERKRLEEEQERKRLQEEQERKRLEEERKRLEEERERKRLEEDRERKRAEEERKHREKEEEKEKEKRLLAEQDKRRADLQLKEKQAVKKAQDPDSSSDSDSKSDSSSDSSSSSSSSENKAHSPRQLKTTKRGEEREQASMIKGTEKQAFTNREVSEPSTAAVTEVEPESESPMAEQPENSEARLDEGTTPKAFAARKISLSGNKTSPAATDGGAGEVDSGTAAGRKRRWGSSTAVTAKKPSFSITTDSLKSLIPDIKVNQDGVVELHPEELQLSGDEENLETDRVEPENDLKIRRTVTQVVPGDDQENGQTNEGEDEEDEAEKTEREPQPKPPRDKRKDSHSEDVSEMQSVTLLDADAKKITPSDSLVRRSISQQKSSVSITIDDPVRTNRQPSPPRGKVSNIIHVKNLVRPFTLGQLKELLNRTGSLIEEGFWIDKIKSHCLVTYATSEEAVATRAALHGVKWPTSNPKVLSVDFSEQKELDFHRGVLKPEAEEDQVVPPGAPQPRLPPLMPGRDRERDRERDRDKNPERERERGVRDLWAERQREMERRERARGEREWDRDKIREFARPGEDGRRSRSREREKRRRERARSKEKKNDKKAEKADEPPAKLLDDLFLKTKAAPCIYWLPLTEEQAAQRVIERAERQKERERRRKEQQEEEEKKREEEKKERLKAREKEGGVSNANAATTRGSNADKERNRDKEPEKRRDSSHHRSRRTPPAATAGGGRRSRSRSNPRERRR